LPGCAAVDTEIETLIISIISARLRAASGVVPTADRSDLRGAVID